MAGVNSLPEDALQESLGSKIKISKPMKTLPAEPRKRTRLIATADQQSSKRSCRRRTKQAKTPGQETPKESVISVRSSCFDDAVYGTDCDTIVSVIHFKLFKTLFLNFFLVFQGTISEEGSKSPHACQPK